MKELEYRPSPAEARCDLHNAILRLRAARLNRSPEDVIAEMEREAERAERAARIVLG